MVSYKYLWFWAKVAGVVSILALSSYVGMKASDLKWEAKYSHLQTQHATERAEMEKQSKELLQHSVDSYQGLQVAIETIDKRQSQELQNVKDYVSKRVDRLYNGTERLSALVVKKLDTTPSGMSSTDQADNPSLDSGEARADLAPRVAASLTRLVGRGDEAIIQLTSCQAILEALSANDTEALQRVLERFKSITPPQNIPTAVKQP